MRDPERIKRITAKLEEAWGNVPDLRLCQLVSLISDQSCFPPVNDDYYREDDSFEAGLDQFNKYYDC